MVAVLDYFLKLAASLQPVLFYAVAVMQVNCRSAIN